MTPEQFNLWKRHPVTAMVLGQYLPDYRGALEVRVMHTWLDGNLNLSGEQQVRGQILGAYMLERMTLEEIRLFYGMAAAEAPRPKPKGPGGFSA